MHIADFNKYFITWLGFYGSIGSVVTRARRPYIALRFIFVTLTIKEPECSGFSGRVHLGKPRKQMGGKLTTIEV